MGRSRKDAVNGAVFSITRSYYEGQMPIEEDFDTTGTSNDTVTRNFVGARGIEAIETVGSSSTTVAYPLYDTHGNMIATVTKNAGGTAWNIGDERNYDVWGSVRQGATTGGPKGRYVANLGHVQDDESGLVYMRARYYEPESGRFISKDAAKDGLNWYVYASNSPSCQVDFTGNSAIMSGAIAGFMFGFVAELWATLTYGGEFDVWRFVSTEAIAAVIGAGWAMGVAAYTAECAVAGVAATAGGKVMSGAGGGIGALAIYAAAVYAGKVAYYIFEAMIGFDEFTSNFPLPGDMRLGRVGVHDEE